jgi:hypothetical protein
MVARPVSRDDPQRQPEGSRRAADGKPLLPTYLGITGLLILTASSGAIRPSPTIWLSLPQSD